MERGLVVDAAVAAIVIFALARGWRNGSLRETFGLVGLFAGVLVGPFLVGPVSSLISTFAALDLNVARLIALIALILVIEMAVIVSARRKMRGAEISGPRWLDRAGGVVIAAFRALTIAVLFLFVFLGISASDSELPGFSEAVATSATGDVLADTSSPITGFYDGLITRTADTRALTLWVRQQTGFDEDDPADRVRFAGATVAVIAARDEERQLLDMLNEAREEQGLSALRLCESCAQVARAHSKDMYEEGYFSHVDLEGRDPFERLKRAKITYAAAGENLAIAPSVAEAHEGLLASPDHRANMLRESFDEVGIGIYEGPYGLMCTEIFRTAL